MKLIAINWEDFMRLYKWLEKQQRNLKKKKKAFKSKIIRVPKCNKNACVRRQLDRERHLGIIYLMTVIQYAMGQKYNLNIFHHWKMHWKPTEETCSILKCI